MSCLKNMLDNTIYRTKSSSLLYHSVEISINDWLAAGQRRNGQNNTQANALPGQSFKPEERFKYLNPPRLSQLINNTKSSKDSQTHLSPLKG